jgi:hypothetical protein
MKPLKNTDTTYAYTAVVTPKENSLTDKTAAPIIEQIKQSLTDGNLKYACFTKKFFAQDHKQQG